MRAIKTVQQGYAVTPELLRLFEQFRQMLNHCIRIGLEGNLTSLKSLSLKAYPRLSGYECLSYYKLGAISRAVGILRNYRKAKRKHRRVRDPYATRLQLLTCYGFKIADGSLLVPFRPNHSIRIPLNEHTVALLSQPAITVRSITLTADTVGITYSKEIDTMKAEGLTAIDRNLDNVTLADSTGRIQRYDLSKATEIKSVYREVKSHLRRPDARIRRRLFQKYGRKQRDRVKQLLHGATKQIIMNAKRERSGIVMEKLTGMRKLYRKGNGQGSTFRGRMNSWSYAELQRQIEYKARWEGIPVTYVNPHGTSARCSICGSRMARIPEEDRILRCRSCGLTVDRDVNAARNILARGLRLSPVAPRAEAMEAFILPAK